MFEKNKTKVDANFLEVLILINWQEESSSYHFLIRILVPPVHWQTRALAEKDLLLFM
jgi:hypothetical protein